MESKRLVIFLSALFIIIASFTYPFVMAKKGEQGSQFRVEALSQTIEVSARDTDAQRIEKILNNLVIEINEIRPTLDCTKGLIAANMLFYEDKELSIYIDNASTGGKAMVRVQYQAMKATEIFTIVIGA